MNRRLNFFLLLLLTACAPAARVVALPEAAATQFVVAAEPTATSILPLPTATLIPCDPAAEEFCIVEGNFIFQNPLGPDPVLAIAGNYSYGSTDEESVNLTMVLICSREGARCLLLRLGW